MKQTPPCRSPLSSLLHLSCLSLGFFWAQPQAAAQNRNFNVASGDWGVETNWAGSLLPGAAETAIIDNNRAAIVTGTHLVGLVQIGYTSTTATNNSLTIEQGGKLTLAGESRLGYSANTKGTVTVRGTWDGITTLYLGGSGEGTLTVGATGVVKANAVQLAATAQGATGSLTLSGRMESVTASIGHRGTGTAHVTSTGSWISTSNLTIGALTNTGLPGGNGTLTIDHGGTVSSVGVTNIGNQAGTVGFALVRGTLTNDDDLRVGTSGSGRLTIGAGGRVNAKSGSGIVYLANQATSPSGILNIGGDVSGSTPAAAEGAGVLNAAEVRGRATGSGMALQFNHTGTDYAFTKTGLSTGAAILISGGATVVRSFSGTTLLTGANTYGGGTDITGVNARIVADHNQALGSQGVTARDGGTVEIAANRSVANAIVLQGGHLVMGAGSRVGGVSFSGTNGSVSGSGTLAQGLTLQAGNRLAPGGSLIGTLQLEGDLTLLSGSFTQLNLAGFGIGQFDLLSGNSENVTFGGELRIDFGGAFALEGSAILFDFENYAGNFSNIVFTGLQDDYLATFNALDGSVSVAAIPEPSTVALLFGGMSLWLWRRRR